MRVRGGGGEGWGWATQPEGWEAALVLSSEARRCPHDPDLRPIQRHQRKQKGGWGTGTQGISAVPIHSVPSLPGELPLDHRSK